jgi:hypothetical protein
MHGIRRNSVQILYSLPVDVRAAVDDWLTLPFSMGMANRHVRTVEWLALHAHEHGILKWNVFKNGGEHLGASTIAEYAIPRMLPGYDITFHNPNSTAETLNRLVVIPRSLNCDLVAEEPFMLLLHVNFANVHRPHMPIHFIDFSPAMPYWGMFDAVSSDELRITRISTKRKRDREMFLMQLMRQKQVPFQLLAQFSCHCLTLVT